MTDSSESWSDVNRRHLMRELMSLRRMLRRHAGPAARGLHDDEELTEKTSSIADDGDPSASAEAAQTALGRLTERFGLSSFEQQVLLLCAGMEFDGLFPGLCAAAQGSPERDYPTFGLALAVLPEADIAALAPHRPLRYWKLISLEGEGLVTHAPLRLDEAVLHYLIDGVFWDPEIAGLAHALDEPMALVPSHHQLVEEIFQGWAHVAPASSMPTIQLVGPDAADLRALAAGLSQAAQAIPFVLSAAQLPSVPRDQEVLTRRWSRMARVLDAIPILDATAVAAGDHDAEVGSRLASWLRAVEGPAVVVAHDQLRLPGLHCVTRDVPRPSTDEQETLWSAALGIEEGELLSPLVANFDLGTADLHAAAAMTRAEVSESESDGTQPGILVGTAWNVCRRQSRPHLEDLAERLDTAAEWADLVLPPRIASQLQAVVAQVRQRDRVYRQWKLARATGRGRGVAALFSGPSGTGKTLAAEVLAHELDLDLFRVDLAAVVSKYIGETEKNLRRIFDAGEAGGAVLLFDEADALFGKRSDVRNSHDRWANIEVSYLLQRVETYRGLAILTSNLPENLDPAFLRRLRVVVKFPFPDLSARELIWRLHLPDSVPTAGVEVAQLARLDLVGGQIRNTALGAAFCAADQGVAVTMDHLMDAARAEYAKSGRTLTRADVREITGPV